MKYIEDYTDEEWLEQNFDRLRKEQIELLEQKLLMARNQMIAALDNETGLLCELRTELKEQFIATGYDYQTHSNGGLIGFNQGQLITLGSVPTNSLTTHYHKQLVSVPLDEREVRAEIMFYKDLLAFWNKNTTYQVFCQTRQQEKEKQLQLEQKEDDQQRQVAAAIVLSLFGFGFVLAIFILCLVLC